MKYRIANLKQYPHQPIMDFAKARNWFVDQLADDEYVLFTSDHEETPKMLLDYISRVDSDYPYYKIRLLRFINSRLEVMYDPVYQPNLVSNRVRFVAHATSKDGKRVHEGCEPKWPFGTIDIPMLHNTDGSHSYIGAEDNRLTHLPKRLLRVYRAILFDELGRGLFRRGVKRLY